MGAQESKTTKLIQIAASKNGGRLFRNHIGLAYTGTVIHDDGAGTVILKNARKYRHGLAKGSADLIGLQPVTITPEMVGNKIAVFCSVEVKSPRGRPTAGQLQWRDMIQAAGGFACISKSVDEFLSDLETPPDFITPEI